MSNNYISNLIWIDNNTIMKMDEVLWSVGRMLISIALSNIDYIRHYVKCSLVMSMLKEKDTDSWGQVVGNACMKCSSKILCLFALL